MDARNCKKCGKLFNYVGGAQICQSCRRDVEEVFKEVKKYIRKNPTATMVEVSESCDVEIKQIRQWVREERLSFSAESNIGIDCERCGKMIRTGRFCESCKIEMQHELNSVYSKKPLDKNTSTEIKMRYLNKDKIK